MLRVIIRSILLPAARLEVARLLEEEKNRDKWLPIAPDGEIPNSIIRLLMDNAQCRHIPEPTLHFKDIAMLIAKVRIRTKRKGGGGLDQCREKWRIGVLSSVYSHAQSMELQ